jgi:phospholipid/cholesterol/gamma-HCH transport system permease protein
LISNFLQNIAYGSLLLKECLHHYGNLLLGKSRFDLPAFASALNDVGLSVLFQLTLISLVVGSILAIQLSFLLESSSFSNIFIDHLTVVILQEFAPLLVGFFVASRSAVNLTVRLASMSVNHEMDGLLICQINPVHFVIAPILLAMIIMSFALVIWTDIMVLISSAIWLKIELDISIVFFINSISSALDFSIITTNIIKPLVFAVISTIIASIYGYQNHRQAKTVAQASSSTMLSALAAILFIDLLFLIVRL